MLRSLVLQNPWEGSPPSTVRGWWWGYSMNILVYIYIHINILVYIHTINMWSCFSGGFCLCKVTFLIAFLLCYFLSLHDESRWVLLQRRVGHIEKPFRISLEYTANGNKSIAAVDSFAMKNCTTGNVPYFIVSVLQRFLVSLWRGP